MSQTFENDFMMYDESGWFNVQHTLLSRYAPQPPTVLCDETPFVFLGAPSVKGDIFRINVLTHRGVFILQGGTHHLGIQCVVQRMLHGDKAQFRVHGGDIQFVRNLPYLDTSGATMYALDEIA